MSGVIRILPEGLINQIAAGEVVERPASVVKELLENAVDAGARDIRVEVLQSGKASIKVADNGRGMCREDLLLAVERHATSKIREYADLFRLRSMGFRGEALPSIAAVSRLTILSVPEGEVSGHRLEIWGGKKISLEEIGGAPGTVVEVRDLFYNTPARMAFLKSPRTEWNQILTALERVALGFPEIRFDLLHNGKKVYQLFPVDDPSLRLKELWGPERTRELIPLQWEGKGLRLSGWISPPHSHQNQPRNIAFIVNRRWVRSPLLYALILRSYSGMLPSGRFPTAVLWMEVPPEWIDVNIHPFKQEVRFSENGLLENEVGRALKQALRSHFPPIDGAVKTPLAGVLEDPKKPEPWLIKEEVPLFQARLRAERWETEAGPGEKAERQPYLDEPAAVTVWGEQRFLGGDGGEGGLAGLALLGQVQGTYWIGVHPHGLVLMDQHAAHERILYERYLRQWREGGVSAQYVLITRLVELPAGVAMDPESLEPELKPLGFEVSPAGGNALWLRAVPSGMSLEQAEKALREILQEMQEEGPRLEPEDLSRNLLKLLACHSAVRAGEALTPEEARALLSELDRIEAPSHCPHGRPLWIIFPWEEIEKRFKRR